MSHELVRRLRKPKRHRRQQFNREVRDAAMREAETLEKRAQILQREIDATMLHRANLLRWIIRMS